MNEISSRMDKAVCNCTCSQTAHAQVCRRCKRILTDICPATLDFERDLVSAGHSCMQLHLHSNCTCTSVQMMQAHLNCYMSSDTRLCMRSRLGWTKLHATALSLKLKMHKCAHDASASQLTYVQRHPTLHEISSRHFCMHLHLH